MVTMAARGGAWRGAAVWVGLALAGLAVLGLVAIVALPPLRASDGRDARVRTLWARIGQGRRLSDAAHDALVRYDWPGNLRQLVASLRTLVALSEPGSEIGVDVLPAYLRARLPAAMPSRPRREESRLRPPAWLS